MPAPLPCPDDCEPCPAICPWDSPEDILDRETAEALILAACEAVAMDLPPYPLDDLIGDPHA